MPSPAGQGLPQWAQWLAEMTGLRDRERLQAHLAEVLTRSLNPLQARLCRRADAAADQFEWVHLAGDEWPEEAAPAHDAHAQALAVERPMLLEGTPCRAYYPLATDRGTDTVLELLLSDPPAGEHRFMAEQMLRVYRNLVGLLDYSERDSLTGLLNRKTFDETFMRLSSPVPPGPTTHAGLDGRRHWHGDDPCWLAVVDIDHFKRVNDQFGHLVGDEVLLLASQLMSDTFRYQDRLYRFGGEEFVVLLRCADAEGARCALERLRRRVAAHGFPQVDHLTISIGFTQVGADDTPESAFGRADKAVYAAKSAGRDQVCAFEDLPAEAGQAHSEPLGAIDFF